MPRPKKITDEPLAGETEETPPDQRQEVSVPLSVLEQLQKTLEEQKEQIAALKENQDILTKAANKAKLERHTPKKSVGLGARIGIFTRDESNRVIVGWRVTKDYVKITKDRETEDQQIQVFLEDGEKVDLPYSDFHGCMERVEIEIDKDKSTWEYAPDGRRQGLITAAFTYEDKDYTVPAYALNP